MNIISAIAHNEGIIKTAEDILNNLGSKDCKIWLTDEAGNVFVPQGKVSIGYYQFMKEEEE